MKAISWRGEWWTRPSEVLRGTIDGIDDFGAECIQMSLVAKVTNSFVHSCANNEIPEYHSGASGLLF